MKNCKNCNDEIKFPRCTSRSKYADWCQKCFKEHVRAYQRIYQAAYHRTDRYREYQKVYQQKYLKEYYKKNRHKYVEYYRRRKGLPLNDLSNFRRFPKLAK